MGKFFGTQMDVVIFELSINLRRVQQIWVKRICGKVDFLLLAKTKIILSL